MHKRKRFFDLVLFSAAILSLVACNLPSPLPQTPEPLPVVTQPTQMDRSTLVPAQPPTVSPVLTFTPPPPMPDFPEMLSFGGGGAGLWGCADAEYPVTPNNINVVGNYGGNIFVCVHVKGINPARQMKVSLTQSGGGGKTLVSKNLLLDKNGEAVLWEQSLLAGAIRDWKNDNAIRFTLVVWWPVILQPGSWRITLYQEGGFQVSRDFQISNKNGKAYIDALDPYAGEEVMPGSPFYGNHLLHLDNADNLIIAGFGYPSNTLVYLLLYLDNQLVQKTVVHSDGSGAISTELFGPFKERNTYILYGITDPNTMLSGVNLVTCYDAVAFSTGAACDYFEVVPAIVSSSCPGAPPQRMIVNQRGRVCTQSDSVRLRSAPARSASTLTQLKPETLFTVIGGPACSDNWSWWNIRLSDGTTGWLTEGGDEVDQYFICP
jgi:hypothetical protein